MKIVAVAVTASLSLSLAGCALDNKSPDGGGAAADATAPQRSAAVALQPTVVAADVSPQAVPDQVGPSQAVVGEAAAAPRAADADVRDAKEAAEEAARKIFDAGVRAATKIKEVGLGAVQAVREAGDDDGRAQGEHARLDRELVAGDEAAAAESGED
ncbi:MAG TPA: hypothetical protein PL143_15650 [Rhodocyclaceae bacterium]|nr:hypothetical protein [Rhodocyclaceae bacterium]